MALPRRASTHAPAITALRARPRGRVEIELDGSPWRTMALDVVLAAGLDVGVELDRRSARRLSQERRRYEAMAKAARALGHRDLSGSELADRLTHSRVAPAARNDVLERLERAGTVNDDRFARRRAEMLADRGGGDALIRHDLASRGIPDELVQAALEALPPERDRAARIVAEREAGAKTARYLARKGFSFETIESVCKETIAEDAPPAVR